MSGTSTIIAFVIAIGSGATLTVAHVNGWDGFGDFSRSGRGGCMPSVQMIGWSQESRSLAETKALIGWSKNAGQHGHQFETWHNAANREMSCKLIGGLTNKCVAKARPCPTITQAAKPNLYY